MTESDPEDYLAFAHGLADASGDAILPHFRSRLETDNKAAGAGFDPVTVADRAAEQVIRQMVDKRWPDHGLEGEEFGTHNPEATLRWVIDPIDGTRAFILGLPIWGTLIGLLDQGKPLLGLMNQPYTRERFWSGRGASFFRGPDGQTRQLETRLGRPLGEAMLSTTDPGLFAKGFEQDRFLEVKGRVRATRYGADCYAYCLLAAGHIDIVVESGLKPYDIVALIPIIEAAGGRVTTWDGGSPTAGGRIVAAGDPRLHEEVLALLA